VRILFFGVLAVAAVAPALVAGIRGPGKYNGVVFYDRWDNNCYLFSGVYLMYISDSLKETLRPFRGRSMEIDAKEVHQPMNPGDGLIKEFAVIGESKDNPRTPSIRGIELRATVSKVAGQMRATIAIRNSGPKDISIDAHALGIAVMAHDKPFFICPSDGTACAVLTRISGASPNGKNTVGRQTWGMEVPGRRPSAGST
jgi:hypothetical protein